MLGSIINFCSKCTYCKVAWSKEEKALSLPFSYWEMLPAPTCIWAKFMGTCFQFSSFCYSVLLPGLWLTRGQNVGIRIFEINKYKTEKLTMVTDAVLIFQEYFRSLVKRIANQLGWDNSGSHIDRWSLHFTSREQAYISRTCLLDNSQFWICHILSKQSLLHWTEVKGAGKDFSLVHNLGCLIPVIVEQEVKLLALRRQSVLKWLISSFYLYRTNQLFNNVSQDAKPLEHTNFLMLSFIVLHIFLEMSIERCSETNI